MEFLKLIVARKASMAGLIIVCLLVAAALLAGVIAPSDPYVGDLAMKLKPGFWSDGGLGLLGTDDQGRDLLTRILYGARSSLYVAALSVALAGAMGLVLGLLSGYFGGWMDTLIMRGCDILLAFPSVLLAIAIVAVIPKSLMGEGMGLEKGMIAIAVVYTPQLARIVRAQALKTVALDFIEAQRALGSSHLRIMALHIAPNILGPVIVFLTLSFGSAILDAAALGFLGLGAEPPRAELGAMLADSRQYFRSAWWAVAFPGLAILFSVLGINLLGDGLRDALDPRMRP